MKCLICDEALESGDLCRLHETRITAIWEKEPIAVFCPVCGCSPMSSDGFHAVFTEQARTTPKPGFPLVLIVYNEKGCHRCIGELERAGARIYSMRRIPQ